MLVIFLQSLPFMEILHEIYHGFLLTNFFKTVLSAEYLRSCPKNIFSPISNMGHKRMDNTVKCMVVRVTIMTGSSSEDWILLALWLQSLLITLNHSTHFQFTVAHALGFCFH
jgi:hypothetical protein